jgi:hypothetical protein
MKKAVWALGLFIGLYPAAASAQCLIHPPAIQGTPRGNAIPGTAAHLTLTFSNQNGGDCGPSSFSVTVLQPSGWTIQPIFTPGISTVGLNPGTFIVTLQPQTGVTLTFALTSPTTTVTASYPVAVLMAQLDQVSNGLFAAIVAVQRPATETLTLTKTSYHVGDTIGIDLALAVDGVPVTGAVIRFVLVSPTGNQIVIQAPLTDRDGKSHADYFLDAGAQLGNWYVVPLVDKEGHPLLLTQIQFLQFVVVN